VKALARRRSSEVGDCVGAVLDRHARKHLGIAVGVCWQDARWTFARGRGGAGRREPPAADTTFEIGSITKVFTATVLADVVQEGLVALEDSVQRYLAELQERVGHPLDRLLAVGAAQVDLVVSCDMSGTRWCQAQATGGVHFASTAMEIGKPRRTYEVEPLEDPVPRELLEEAPEPERPVETPGEPEQVPSPAP
jgi:hypothetical protein